MTDLDTATPSPRTPAVLRVELAAAAVPGLSNRTVRDVVDSAQRVG